MFFLHRATHFLLAVSADVRLTERDGRLHTSLPLPLSTDLHGVCELLYHEQPAVFFFFGEGGVGVSGKENTQKSSQLLQDLVMKGYSLTSICPSEIHNTQATRQQQTTTAFLVLQTEAARM